jgi:cupin superfamily acireductone dioxygenase involved in methionine salvage
VHEINKAEKEERKYVEKHNHPKPEINILLGNVKYKITLGDEEYIVQAPANIWIPKGLDHSATLMEGTGYFICLILSNKYTANGK